MALAQAHARPKEKATDQPNMIMGSNVQVVWEKFCRYWDVEPRYLPMERGRYVITPEQVANAVDENTIGVVAILGTTYTGEFEPDQGDSRRARQAQRRQGLGGAAPRRRREWGLRGSLPAPGTRVGLPSCRSSNRSTPRGTNTASSTPVWAG